MQSLQEQGADTADQHAGEVAMHLPTHRVGAEQTGVVLGLFEVDLPQSDTAETKDLAFDTASKKFHGMVGSFAGVGWIALHRSIGWRSTRCGSAARGPRRMNRASATCLVTPYILACGYRFRRCSIKPSTTVGSARVEVSPMFSSSLQAILRRMRRMILPERVFGRPGAHWISSGLAKLPISLPTKASSSCFSASLISTPFIGVTKA